MHRNLQHSRLFGFRSTVDVQKHGGFWSDVTVEKIEFECFKGGVAKHKGDNGVETIIHGVHGGVDDARWHLR